MQKNVDDNEGIATVFRFASPENKSVTGPLSRFTQMIKRGYPDMLNHTSARLEDIDIAGDVATQAVWLQTQSGTEERRINKTFMITSSQKNSFVIYYDGCLYNSFSF
jgi:hypothetical protein